MADCQVVLECCQRQNERRDWGFTWTSECARRRRPSEPHGAGVRIRVLELGARDTSLEYESSGGQASGRATDKIRWPTTVGETVVDGEITWTARALSTASLEDQIATSVWQPPSGSGLIVDDDSVSQAAGLQQTAAFVDSAAASTNQVYDILNLVTTVNGRRFEGVLRLTVDD